MLLRYLRQVWTLPNHLRLLAVGIMIYEVRLNLERAIVRIDATITLAVVEIHGCLVVWLLLLILWILFVSAVTLLGAAAHQLFKKAIVYEVDFAHAVLAEYVAYSVCIACYGHLFVGLQGELLRIRRIGVRIILGQFVRTAG